MDGEAMSPLQALVQQAIDRSGKARDYFDSRLQKKLGTTGKPIWDIIRGKSKKPNSVTLAAVGKELGVPVASLIAAANGEAVHLSEQKAAHHGSVTDDDIEMVGIRHADAAFGLGSAFTEFSHESTEIQVLQFPKVWVESITYSPVELLSWVRAKGDSMYPTIKEGDLILLDHSDRKVEDQDDIWAFAVGDTRSIKRLRVKGDRYVILSDNPSVPEDEELIDFVNVIARVCFVGRRR